MSYASDELLRFVVESNAIEGITRKPTNAELEAHRCFLAVGKVTPDTLQALVSVCAPGAMLRTQRNMNVRVGDHYPPPGGPEIALRLEALLEHANTPNYDPHWVHIAYETLHPFMDGNGRSGRALWAWMMLRQHGWGIKLGFLRAFYYQTLSASRR